jgi:multidrug resistance efflux pump
MKIRFDLPPASAQESNGLSVRYAAAKRQVPRWRWHLLLTLVLLPPLYFALRFASSYWWETAPGFVLMPDIVVKAGAPGRLAAVAPLHSQLRAGDALAQLDTPLPAPALVGPGAETGLLSAARRHAAEEAVRLAKAQLQLRQQRLHAVRQLMADGAATAAEHGSAEAQVLAARSELTKANLELAQARAAGAPRAVTGPSAASATAAALGRVPADGELVRVFVQAGEWVSADTEIGVVRKREAPRIQAYVDPSEVRYARPGRRATLRFADGTAWPATVERVAPEAQRLPPERVAPLAPRGQSIVVELRPDRPLPARYHVHHLPLDVRFEHLWPWSD